MFKVFTFNNFSGRMFECVLSKDFETLEAAKYAGREHCIGGEGSYYIIREYEEGKNHIIRAYLYPTDTGITVFDSRIVRKERNT